MRTLARESESGQEFASGAVSALWEMYERIVFCHVTKGVEEENSRDRERD